MNTESWASARLGWLSALAGMGLSGCASTSEPMPLAALSPAPVICPDPVALDCFSVADATALSRFHSFSSSELALFGRAPIATGPEFNEPDEKKFFMVSVISMIVGVATGFLVAKGRYHSSDAGRFDEQLMPASVEDGTIIELEEDSQSAVVKSASDDQSSLVPAFASAAQAYQATLRQTFPDPQLYVHAFAAEAADIVNNPEVADVLQRDRLGVQIFGNAQRTSLTSITACHEARRPLLGQECTIRVFDVPLSHRFGAMDVSALLRQAKNEPGRPSAQMHISRREGNVALVQAVYLSCRYSRDKNSFHMQLGYVGDDRLLEHVDSAILRGYREFRLWLLQQERKTRGMAAS